MLKLQEDSMIYLELFLRLYIL